MLSILIVDDDIPTVEFIRDSVHWANLKINNVYTAYNIRTAKKVLEENKIDIVVSDIEMPRGTGLDLLEWLRSYDSQCEFLLLTCHESFHYAAQAINLDAAAYLIKPLDIALMELSLRKIIEKIEQNNLLVEKSKRGDWLAENSRAVTLHFWEMLLSGQISSSAQIEKEVASRGIDIDVLGRFYLVYFKISSCEADIARLGQETFGFILESFISEILLGKFINDSVVKNSLAGGISYCAVVAYQPKSDLSGLAERIMQACGNHLKCTVTVYISEPCNLEEVVGVKARAEQVLQNNLGHYGRILWESDAAPPGGEKTHIMDLARLNAMVEAKNKAAILQYVKNVFEELALFKSLNVHSLFLMQQEIIQSIYADLLKNGIQSTLLFHDETSMRMSEQASESTVDMIRWLNYLLEKSFHYRKEVQQASGVIERIHLYVQNHYSENISRNEIAKELFLAPEYLSKLYSKKTGKHLKDYINEYRIERAKDLLKNGGDNISLIAQSVGFDNFSYFSTLFKKIVGITPKEFQKSQTQ